MKERYINTSLKVAYIAHPIGGDVKNNLEKVKQIARKINLEEPDIIPFAPYYLDCHCLDDSNPKERSRGMENSLNLLEMGIVDELRLYGDRITTGMGNEIIIAKIHLIKIIPMTEETEIQFTRY